MKHKYNYRLIKSNEIYTIKELSELLSIHSRTIQKFVKYEKLEVINPESTPFLIKGVDAKNFFQKRINEQKYSLRYFEFNCFHCNKPVESIPEEIKTIETNKKLGKNAFKIDVRGVCNCCGANLYRMSSSNKITQLTEYYWNKLDQQNDKLEHY